MKRRNALSEKQCFALHLRPLTLSLLLKLSPNELPAPALSLRVLSTLRLKLELLLLRRCFLTSDGSWGCKPLASPNRFKISVRLMTPVKRPERLAPGTVVADALELELIACDEPAEAEVLPAAGPGKLSGLNGAEAMAGVSNGVGGPDEAGEGDSTTHMRCDRVATSLATV